MKLSIISFTENGKRLAEDIAAKLCECDQTGCILILQAETSFREMPVREWTKIQMQERNAMLFIGACGIAVRAIAPYLTDKLHDSPVLVMDERGKYVIPVLSGHVGGANEIARYLGRITGAEPVITTATDLNDKFAVDLFAKENDLCILNKEGIAKVSSKALADEEITVSIEPGYESGLVWREGYRGQNGGLPENIHKVPYPPTQYVDIVVTAGNDAFDAAVILQPREYAIGLGCRKGKSAAELDHFIRGKLSEYGIAVSQVFALASISVKSGEQGIECWCRKENIPFCTYTAEELQAVEGEFTESSFVKEQVGVANVCERAALRACGEDGRLICAKRTENGMTFALARRAWKRQG
ncbi:MAG: cobalt-precorrin 5A hydrolase [Eubacterium sp.]|nr:cobalt-precorrin 5A hydrolase [Eubacterium sp.]